MAYVCFYGLNLENNLCYNKKHLAVIKKRKCTNQEVLEVTTL